MTLESTTYINGLNASYPEGGADRSTADDHLRLIKSAVKATFPNVTGAVTATHTQLNLVVGATKTLASVSALTVKYSLSISALNTQLDSISNTVSVINARVVSMSALDTQYSLSISAIKASISAILTDTTKFSLSISALTTSLNSVSVVLQAAVASVSVALNTDLHSVSAVLQASINAVSNTVSVINARVVSMSALDTSFAADLARISQTVSVVIADVARISQTVSVVIASAAAMSLSISAIKTQIGSLAYVPLDATAGGVGTFALMYLNATNTAIASASVYTGSSLRFVTFRMNNAFGLSAFLSSAVVPGGTWRASHAVAAGLDEYGVCTFQRIT